MIQFKSIAWTFSCYHFLIFPHPLATCVVLCALRPARLRHLPILTITPSMSWWQNLGLWYQWYSSNQELQETQRNSKLMTKSSSTLYRIYWLSILTEQKMDYNDRITVQISPIPLVEYSLTYLCSPPSSLIIVSSLFLIDLPSPLLFITFSHLLCQLSTWGTLLSPWTRHYLLKSSFKDLAGPQPFRLFSPRRAFLFYCFFLCMRIFMIICQIWHSRCSWWNNCYDSYRFLWHILFFVLHQIFDLFDVKQKGMIDFGDFVRGLNVFRPNAPHKDKVDCKSKEYYFLYHV